MPDADNDESEEYNGASFSKDVDQDLKDWLGIIRGDSVVEILNAEQEAEYEEPSEYSRTSNGHQNTEWS